MKDDQYWRDKLTPEEYHVCREKGTERAFTGEYWDCNKDGVYNCRCCGWPSFFQPADSEVIEEARDTTHGMIRTEVMCKKCGAHLGHVFPDGPAPTGMRYCINSLSIKLDEEGKGS